MAVVVIDDDDLAVGVLAMEDLVNWRGRADGVRPGVILPEEEAGVTLPLVNEEGVTLPFLREADTEGSLRDEATEDGRKAG
jgi:hypothetical protein